MRSGPIRPWKNTQSRYTETDQHGGDLGCDLGGAAIAIVNTSMEQCHKNVQQLSAETQADRPWERTPSSYVETAWGAWGVVWVGQQWQCIHGAPQEHTVVLLPARVA